MTPYKVTYPSRTSPPTQPARLLLALSLGSSSLALLEMLLEHLRDQMETHRGATGFTIVAVHVDCSPILSYNRDPKAVIQELQKEFSELCTFETVSIDEFLQDQELLGTFTHLDLETYSFSQCGELASRSVKSDILDKIRDRTAKQDFLFSIIHNLLVRSARSHNSSHILFGDSMSRLAERVLSLTSKGRGAAVSSSIADNIICKNGIAQLYPMREIMRAEAEAYVAMQDFSQYVITPTQRPPTILRMMTIDDLLVNYFTDIEAGFPSIVSTVVRTADKLKDTTAESNSVCALCGVKCLAEPERWLKEITVSKPALEGESLEPTETSAQHSDKPILCYGCLVATNSSSFTWPRSSKDEILRQYEL